MTIPIKELTERTRRDPDTGCLRWTGAHAPNGYGQIRIATVTRSVHRVAYERWVGPIPDGMEIDHVHENGCRYRDCIEPSQHQTEKR